jgi:hypothetical protein
MVNQCCSDCQVSCTWHMSQRSIARICLFPRLRCSTCSALVILPRFSAGLHLLFAQIYPLNVRSQFPRGGLCGCC